MIRAFIIAAAAVLLLGATRPPATVDYRLGVTPQAAGAPPVLDVEIRLRGDADGETLLNLPDRYGDSKDAWRFLSGLTVEGARSSAPDAAHRLLRHRPGAKLVVRYQVRTAYDQDPPGREANTYRGPLIRPAWFALLGDFVFAAPDGRDAAAATFRWGRLPSGWRTASDLDHGATGRPLRVADVVESISIGGPNIEVLQRPIPGGLLRVVRPLQTAAFPDTLADDIAKVIVAQRGFWNDIATPYFVGLIPLDPTQGRGSGGTGRGDGFILYASPGATDGTLWLIAHEHTHTWIADRLARLPDNDAAAGFWFSEGFTDFFASRTLVRSGLVTPADAVQRLASTLRAYDASPVKTAPNSRIVTDFWTNQAFGDLPYQRGALLALKWDEAVRRKTGGKADLDDVILHMRDHFQKFVPGTGPDVVTGLVSAAWVVAGIDLGPDIARYVNRGEAIVLPDEMFDGCLQAAVTVSPGFESGFNAEASFAARKVTGVRRRGPAWNSGLRDGMVLDAWSYKAGDMTRMIELTIHPTGRKARPRKIAYWPYGDADTQTRALRLTPGMTEAQHAACGRKIGGL